MPKDKQLQYCRRRPTPYCKIQTYNKDAICTNCQMELQEIVNDLEFIRILKLTPKLYE